MFIHFGMANNELFAEIAYYSSGDAVENGQALEDFESLMDRDFGNFSNFELFDAFGMSEEGEEILASSAVAVSNGNNSSSNGSNGSHGSSSSNSSSGGNSSGCNGNNNAVSNFVGGLSSSVGEIGGRCHMDGGAANFPPTSIPEVSCLNVERSTEGTHKDVSFSKMLSSDCVSLFHFLIL